VVKGWVEDEAAPAAASASASASRHVRCTTAPLTTFASSSPVGEGCGRERGILLEQQRVSPRPVGAGRVRVVLCHQQPCLQQLACAKVRSQNILGKRAAGLMTD